MRSRRVVAQVPLSRLGGVFDDIRLREGVSSERSVAAETEARSGGGDADPSHIVGSRRDLTHIPFVTVDPLGARDLDQAFHLARRGVGWRLLYAIADVGAHVSPGGAIDVEAWTRAETVYCPDERIGLHPPAMAEGYASLLAGQRTKAVVWEFDVDGGGAVTEMRLYRAWVRSVHQYSYQDFHLPGRVPDQIANNVRVFGQARAGFMSEAGAVTLSKPTQEVSEDHGSLTVVLRGADQWEEHNAQLSLMTGLAAASLMISSGHGVLRTMPPADDAAVARLRRQAVALGIVWPEATPYAQCLRQVDPATPAGAAFLTAATQLFRGAAWEGFDESAGLAVPKQVLHGALAAPYAHVTAPLRRLVDRYATEACLAAFEGRDLPEWVAQRLGTVGGAMAAGARRGSAVDKACMNAVEGALLEPHVGQSFSAIALSGSEVQLTSVAVVAPCEGDLTPGALVTVSLTSSSPVSGPRCAVVEERGAA